MNYKKVPYSTIWLQHPEIEPRAKEIGAAPTSTKADGSPFYTCPIIYDPNTGRAVSESSAIIKYLDATYPDTPKLIPTGVNSLHAAFRTLLGVTLAPLWQFALPATTAILYPEAAQYFGHNLEVRFGKQHEDIVPKGQVREEEWKKLLEAFNQIAGWMEEGQMFVMGDDITSVDLDIVGILIWCKRVWGADSTEWQEIAGLKHGRWAALVDYFDKYADIV